MKAYIFQVVIEPDEDGFHAYCPILKGCHTWGNTRKEVLNNVGEAELTKIRAFDSPSVAMEI